jgi:hypothetical protein
MIAVPVIVDSTTFKTSATFPFVGNDNMSLDDVLSVQRSEVVIRCYSPQHHDEVQFDLAECMCEENGNPMEDCHWMINDVEAALSYVDSSDFSTLHQQPSVRFVCAVSTFKLNC